MGSDQSSYEDVKVFPQTSPICGIEPRFCLPNPIKLRLREKIFSFSGDDFKICDADDGTLYFRCAGKTFSLKDKKTLLDVNGQPVLNMKQPLMSLSDKYKIYAGANSDKELFTFKTERNYFKAKLAAFVKNPVNNSHHYLVLKGNWRDKKAVVFLGEPKQDGIPVAKVYRPLSGKSLFFGADEYLIEIAPGVDIALILSMCIALDEHQRD